ncbi:MAG: zinc ribbon domain-containing protein [Verrucomicrobiales bacterium]|nr:zinc ribbon domain-containing protein [Verrucomicrobiales bacterium]
MPFYDYYCRDCGEFALNRSIAQRDDRALCPQCNGAATRVVTAPRLALMQPMTRMAQERNERSRHEPSVSQRHRCGSGCGCSSGPSRMSPSSATAIAKKRSVEVPKLGRFQTGRRRQRPWMLGH